MKLCRRFGEIGKINQSAVIAGMETWPKCVSSEVNTAAFKHLKKENNRSSKKRIIEE